MSTARIPPCCVKDIDGSQGKIYWVDEGTRSIRRANLDGSGAEEFVRLPFGRRTIGLTIEPALPAAETACRFGNVNADGSGLVDVLLVNGSAGDALREVSVAGGGALVAEMTTPPAATARPFFVHANFGSPDPGTVTDLPLGLGRACFPMLLSQGAMPDAIWNGLGKEHVVGSSTGFDGQPIPDPGPTPFVFPALPNGDPVHLPVGTTVTFQGVVRDPSAAGARKASVSNAVVVRVE